MAVFFQPWIIKKTRERDTNENNNIIFLTIALGFLLGGLVTITSVGAGAMGVTALIFLYPRIKISRIIGTDIAHAVPLTMLAGIGHYNLGNVDIRLLGALLIGSLPGVLIGSYLSDKFNEKTLRYILAIILMVVSFELIFNT